MYGFVEPVTAKKVCAVIGRLVSSPSAARLSTAGRSAVYWFCRSKARRHSPVAAVCVFVSKATWTHRTKRNGAGNGGLPDHGRAPLERHGGCSHARPQAFDALPVGLRASHR